MNKLICRNTNILQIKMKKIILLLVILGNMIFVSNVYSQKSTIEERLTKIEERLTKIEERLTKIEERITILEVRVDEVNKRIDMLQTQFYLLYILLAAIIALIGVMVNAVIKFTKEERPIGRREYEKILAREDLLEEEINKLKKEIQLRLKPTNPQNT